MKRRIEEVGQLDKSYNRLLKTAIKGMHIKTKHAGCKFKKLISSCWKFRVRREGSYSIEFWRGSSKRNEESEKERKEKGIGERILCNYFYVELLNLHHIILSNGQY